VKISFELKMKKEKKIADLFWADQFAQEVVAEKGEKGLYTCASRISPSGKIHFGNIREIMTAELVKRALIKKGKRARVLHHWDDFDRFRKVPPAIPENYEKYIGVPYCFIPDPFNCHESYAHHFEEKLESEIKQIGIEVETIRQHERYINCYYAEQIHFVLNNRETIRGILSKYRSKPLGEDWYPVEVYCEKCKKDSTKIVSYDEKYSITYKCECGFENAIDFRKKGIVKLPWRIEWPMMWVQEDVDFEAGGKEHSTPGGSITTGREIIEAVWNKKAPVYKKYEFVILKSGGKMSGSLGNVITLSEVLEVYEPQIVRFMFAGTRPGAEFFVSFDLDVLKVYEDFDSCERVYFGKQQAKDEKDLTNKRRIYELSSISLQKKMPLQPSFRHLTTMLQVYENDFEKVKAYYGRSIKTKHDVERLKLRAACAWRWLQKYAPEEMRFAVQETVKAELSAQQKRAITALASALKEKKWTEQDLFKKFYDVCGEVGIKPEEFFKAAYKVLLNKEKGPRLAPFIIMLGERAAKLFGQVK
jgi:lysyl-tRNA synthetase class 1